MSIIKKFILTSRYDKPLGILLLYIPCIWGISLYDFSISEDILLCIIFLAGASGMRALGCIWNDYTDKDFDKKINRTKTRLIASDQVSNREIIIFVLINAAIGSFPLYFIPLHSILISFSILPIVIIYPYMKRYTWWPQFWLGLCFNWGIFIGHSVYNQNLLQIELILFYLGAVFFTIGYDTIYGFQDVLDDEIVGVKSTSLKFKNKPKYFLSAIYFICFSFWFTSLYLLKKPIFTLCLLVSAFFLFFVVIMLTNTNDVKECKNTFRYNTYFSFVVLMILVFN